MVKQFYSVRCRRVAAVSLTAFLICFSELSFAAEYKLVWPVASALKTTPVTAKKKYITQIGVVAIPTNAVKLCAQMKKGDTLQLGFFAKSAYSVTVQAVTRHGNGVVSVRGTAKGQDMQTFTLSAGTDGFIMTMQDLGKHRLYRVVGDTRKGQAVVREIDPKKMPPSYDLPALVPPADAKTSNKKSIP